MAVWSEVKLDETFSTLNFAAEHYHPKKLEYLNLLNSFDGLRVGEIFTSVKDIFDPAKHILSEPARVYDLTDSLGNFLNEGNEANEETFKSAKKIVRHNDIIVSRLRSYLKEMAVVPNIDEQVLVSTEYIVLRPSNDSLSENYKFILPFLLTEPIQTILHWSQDGNEHPRFAESVLLNLNVPKIVINQKSILKELVDEAQNKIELSKTLYQEAETLLLHELELDALDLSNEITYERNFDEVARAGRLDAQYFAPRYQRTLRLMSKSGETIGDVAPLAKRLFRPKLADEYFEYIEIGSLTGDGRAESEKLLSAEAPSRAQWVVRKDDVITSTVRPIRRLSALIETHQEDFVCSSGFAVLEPKTIEPEVLLVWLRLPIISEILDLHTTATMYPAIAVDTLLRIPITKPSEPVSKQIVQKIQDSREAIKTAKQLLEDAKQCVEDMILGN